MATYTEDWSGSTLNAEPTGWTKRHAFTSNTQVAVQEDAQAPTGRRARFTKSSTERALLSFNAVDSDGDRATYQARVLVRVTWAGTTNSNSYAGIMGRASGTSETGEVGAMAHETGSQNPAIRHNRYVDGAATVVSTTPATWNSGELYWLTITNSGTSQTLQIAPHNDPQNIIATLNTSLSVTAAGWIGLWTFTATNSSVSDFLWVGIGTGADNAPYPVGVLSNAAAEATGSTTAAGTVDVNLSHGTLYAVATQSATPPSAAELRLGQDHTGEPASYAESKTVSAPGEQSFSAEGLSASTSYYWHFLHENVASDGSNITTSNSFTTLEAGVIRLSNNLPLYDTPTGPLTNLTDVSITVLTLDATPSVVYHDALGTVVDGYVQLTDAAFETVNEEFEMVLRKGTRTRSVAATVVES